MLKPFLTAASAAILLTACEPVAGASGASSADPLAGTWRVASIGGTKVEDLNATEMTFTNLTQVSGTFGCNRFTGNYTYDRNVVFISDVITTRMACIGAPERQERHGLRLLGMPMTVVADPNAAILSGREGQSFALER